MSQLMRAVKKFSYPSGVKRRPGDIFSVKGRHATQLSAARLAVVVDDAPKLVYETRHMEAKPVGGMTVLELREEANKRGISLPRGYLSKTTLLDIVGRA